MITLICFWAFLMLLEKLGAPISEANAEVLIILLLCVIGDIIIFKRK